MARRTIAVIDDDPDILALLTDFLTGEDYRIVTWDRGAGAFDLLKREMPALLILDIRMERPLAGWRVLNDLRLDPATRHIPTIVCSADRQILGEEGERLRALRCTVVPKPFALDDLLATIERLIDEPAAASRR